MFSRFGRHANATDRRTDKQKNFDNVLHWRRVVKIEALDEAGHFDVPAFEQWSIPCHPMTSRKTIVYEPRRRALQAYSIVSVPRDAIVQHFAPGKGAKYCDQPVCVLCVHRVRKKMPLYFCL